jgi:hypothetical protein
MNAGQAIPEGGTNESASAAKTTSCCAAADAAAALADTSEYGLYVKEGQDAEGLRKTKTPHCDTLVHGDAAPAARASASFAFA